MIRTLIPATLMIAFVCGCAANQEADDGNGRWELPAAVDAGFNYSHPGAKVAKWDRRVSDYDEVAYLIHYRTPEGKLEETWLNAQGQVIGRPSWAQ